ncbi:MAG: hypothetical protein AMXMBFR80_23270 [Dehalococcoidia bacterium]
MSPGPRWLCNPRSPAGRALAHGRTERAAAEALGLQIEGFRSVVRELKEITGLNSTRDLGEWWRRNMGAWLEYVSTIAQGEVSPDSWTG